MTDNDGYDGFSRVPSNRARAHGAKQQMTDNPSFGQNVSLVRWAILRCANCKTLDLAASLNEAGFEAWTPVEVIRRGAKLEEARVPLMASYVFAQAEQLHELLSLSRSPALNYRVWDAEKRRMVTKGHPHFGFFRQLGEIATLHDGLLAPLRSIERRRKPRGTIKPIAPGTTVRLSDGGFEGLTGVVASIHGKYAQVTFDHFPLPVKFPCWLLREAIDEQAAVNINHRPSERAARAA